MAAILVETLVPNTGAAVQAILAEWATYVPNATWTFTVNSGSGQNRRTLESVTNDTVNTTTRRYYVNDVINATFPSVQYLASLPGISDMSPPVLAPAYGARNTITDFTNNFWTLVFNHLATWTNLAGVSFATTNLLTQATGFVQTQFLGMLHNGGQIGLVTACLTTRNAATATLAASGTFPTQKIVGTPTLATPASVTQEVMERIANTLDEINLRGRDWSFNSGNIHVSSSGSIVSP